jgi:hypothetical protein
LPVLLTFVEPCGGGVADEARLLDFEIDPHGLTRG